MPTPRLVAYLGLALVFTLLSVLHPALGLFAVAWDLGVLSAAGIDFLRAPGGQDVRLARRVEPLLQSAATNRVQVVLERTGDGRILGEFRDTVPEGLAPQGHRQAFALPPGQESTRLHYLVTPLRRGDFLFGDLWVRLRGPFGLMQRQLRFPAPDKVKAYPSLVSLERDALLGAERQRAAGDRLMRRSGEGREFDSLRDYRAGDDARAVDWKATARRGGPVVRIHRPEQNQTVLLLLDCGRHMAGRAGQRRKLDAAVEATLRLARASLAHGDRVGLVRFAGGVQALVPPGKGTSQARLLTSALYAAEASLEESDYGAAVDRALLHARTRSLFVLLTDLLDSEAAFGLMGRMAALAPRHLPLVLSLFDEDVRALVDEAPRTEEAAHLRAAAVRLEDDANTTVARLRDRGARVVRTSASTLAAAALREYLAVKASGRL